MHTKPTAEELQANIDNSIKELDALENPKPQVTTPPETPVATPVVEPPKIEPPVAPSLEKKEEVTTPVVPVVPVTTPPETPSKKEEDIRTRYIESTREAQVLYLKNKKYEEAIETAKNLPEPTEDELKIESTKQGFQFEDMTPVEKALFKTSIHTARKLGAISQVSQEGKDLEEWNKKVDVFVEDPETLTKFTDLEGKQEEFKVFASRPSRRGSDFADLVSSFLFNVEKERPKHKGQMFETGSAGPNDKPNPKPAKVSLEESEIIREKDYKRWKELNDNNMIETEIPNE